MQNHLHSIILLAFPLLFSGQIPDKLLEIHLKGNVTAASNANTSNGAGLGLAALLPFTIRESRAQFVTGLEFNQSNLRTATETHSGPLHSSYRFTALTIPFVMRYAAGKDLQLLAEAGVYLNLMLGIKSSNNNFSGGTGTSSGPDAGPRVALGCCYQDVDACYYLRIEHMSGLRNYAYLSTPVYNRLWSLCWGIAF